MTELINCFELKQRVKTPYSHLVIGLFLKYTIVSLLRKQLHQIDNRSSTQLFKSSTICLLVLFFQLQDYISPYALD